MERWYSLTTRKTKALQALLTEPTKRAAAERAGISESTLRSYFSDREFQRAYKEAFAEVVTEATREAQRSLYPAIKTLQDIVEDEEQPGSSRISAARSILEYGLRLTEAVDVIERLNTLEEQFNEQQN